MSDMPALDEPGPAGCSSDAAAVAVQTAGALAVELRERLALLAPPRGLWPGWDERDVLRDALTGIGALRDAVPRLGAVRSWSETQALDPALRVDRRALAAVRSLEELVRRGRLLSAAEF